MKFLFDDFQLSLLFYLKNQISNFRDHYLFNLIGLQMILIIKS